MITLLDYSLKELETIVYNLGEKKFRAKQIQEGLYRGKILNEITTLSNDFKSKLMDNGYISQPLSMLDKRVSEDETIKFVFKLYDNNIIECVLLKYEHGYSLCVSTQVGCKMNCSFCASGKDGFVRNLTSGEILAQVIQANLFLGGGLGEYRKITNIVLMGTGEPLDNYENVVKFLRLVSSEFGISERNISLSTCGLVDKITRLADENLNITLTISLHASNDELRKSIMPIANVYTIKSIMQSLKYYFSKTKRRIVFEYIVLPNINDSTENALELKRLMKDISYHINLIPYNSTDEETGINKTDRTSAYNFCNKLQKLGMSVTVRRTMGDDIEGACGQLRRKYLNE